MNKYNLKSYAPQARKDFIDAATRRINCMCAVQFFVFLGEGSRA
jgi:hypothetical protein